MLTRFASALDVVTDSVPFLASVYKTTEDDRLPLPTTWLTLSRVPTRSTKMLCENCSWSVESLLHDARATGGFYLSHIDRRMLGRERRRKLEVSGPLQDFPTV